MQKHPLNHRPPPKSKRIGLGMAVSLFLVMQVLLAPVARAQRAAIPRGAIVVFSGAMTSEDRGRSERVSLPPGPVGWEIVLEADNPKAVDLDLYVYPMTASGSRRSLCSSEGIEAREVCRVLPIPTEPVMIEVTPNGGDGRTEFRVTRRPLPGPRMGDTPAIADDAISTLTAGEWRQSNTLETPYGNDNTGVLFRLGDGAEPRRLIAVSAAGERAVHIAAFDANGKPVAEARDRAEAGYVDLVVDRTAGAAYVLVSPERGGPFRIGAWPFGEPLPVPASAENWTAVGTQSRLYTLTLEPGETAAVELEATGAGLEVIGADGQV